MKLVIYLFILIFLTSCDRASLTETTETLTPYSEGSWYKPQAGISWQWQLQGVPDTSYNVDIYDLDLFDTNSSLIHSLQSDGKKVICYFSAGSYENWRIDSDAFPSSALGNDLDGWEGEKWLDISNEAIKPIMLARLDVAKKRGCDGVEPDNVDGYMNNTGFQLSANDQLAYNKFIANEARKRGLSVGLKNDLEQVVALEPFYDFSVNEQCHALNECDKLTPFIQANKAVFNAEYSSKYVENRSEERDVICSKANELQLSTLILPQQLDNSFRYSCQ